MAELLSLAPEIQHVIIKKLNFPDLSRLRMTCRHMRDLPMKDTKYRALLRLEADWIIATRTAAKSKTRASSRDEPDCLPLLVKMGYLEAEVKSMRESAPCMRCMQLKPGTSFEGDEVNQPLYLCHYGQYQYLGGKKPSKVNRDRMCVDCLLDSQDLSKAACRWVVLVDKRIVACRGCDGSLCDTDRDICRRQRIAELCDDCFEDIKAEWEDFKETLESQKTVYENQIKSIQRKFDSAESYIWWMEEVDSDENSESDTPAPRLELEGLPEPQWDYLSRVRDGTDEESNIEMDEADL